MNVSDYASRINAEREKYNKAQTRLREDYKQTTENQNNTHELKEEKQAENYNRITREQEENINKLSNQYNEKTKDEIKNRQEKFNGELGVRRVAFEEENRRLRNNLSEKLSTLKSEYDKNIYENDKNKDEIIADIKSRFGKSDLGRKKEFDESLKDIQGKSRETFKNYVESEKLAKRNMIEDHSDEVQKTIVDNNLEKNRISNRNQETIEQLRKVFGSEKETMSEYHDGVTAQIRAENKENLGQIRDNFQTLTDNLTRKNDHDQAQLLNESKSNLRAQELKFDKDRHALNRKTNAIVESGDSGDSSKSEVNRLKNAQEARIDKLKQNMADQRAFDQLSKEKAAEMSREVIRGQNLASLEIRDNLEKEHNDYNREVVGGIRKQKDQVIEQYTKLIHDQDEKSTEALIKERNHGKKILENQRNEFAKSINAMTEKNILASEETREDYAKNSKSLIENSRRQNYNDSEEMKSQFNTKLIKTAQSYEQRIEGQNKDIENLTKFYENKINVMGKKSAKELETTRIYAEQRRIEDERTYKREMELREELNRQEIVNMKERFARNLDKTKADYDSKMSRLVNEYEDLLALQQQQNDKESGIKLAEARDNYEKLVKQTELQREGMKSQYEARMEKMRLTNAQNLEELARGQTKRPAIA